MTAIGPALATITVFALVSELWSQLAFDPSHGIARSLLAINAASGSDLPGLLLLGMLHQLLWFIGLHGSYLLQDIQNVLLAAPAAASGLPALSNSLI